MQSHRYRVAYLRACGAVRTAAAITTIGVLGPVVAGAQVGSGNESVSSSVRNLPAYVSPFIGLEATGGTVASCPSGRIMVGVAGTKTSLIKALTPVCGTFKKDGSFAIVAPVDQSAVASGATGFHLQCSAGHAVTQVRVSFDRANATSEYLGGLEIGCSSWLLGLWSGARQPLATAGFEMGTVRVAVACTNQTQPIHALQIRAVTGVKALSIICDEL